MLFSACFVAGCASAFAAFDIPAPPARLISGIMIVALVAALPIAVAGLGTSQAAFVYLFADVAPAERLLAMSLVLSFGIISLRAAMGLCFARELTREALQDARIADGVSRTLFTGERLHDDLRAVRGRPRPPPRRLRVRAPSASRARACSISAAAAGPARRCSRAPARARSASTASRPIRESRRSGAAFCRAELAALPLRARRFDAVVSFQVIEHLADPAPYLRAIGELLATGRHRAVSTPNRQLSDGVNPYHVREYLGAELRRAARAPLRARWRCWASA